MTVNDYAFDNAAVEASARFEALETCYDPATRAQLARTGLTAGWRCLEVGAGGGSVGLWLSDVVGPGGQVTATDIAPERIAPELVRRQNTEVVRHDVVREAPPGRDFDLIHARLVLLHLPERLEVLGRLVEALRPGGWLVLDEFDCGWTPVLRAPDAAAAELFDRVHTRLLALLDAAGADVRWGRHAYQALADAGLGQTSAATFGEDWPGGGPGISLHAANVGQLRGRLLSSGLTEAELDGFQRLLDDPEFCVHSYPMITTMGRRPLGPRTEPPS